MNRLPTKTRAQALNMLVEGSSMSSVSRILGIDINTVIKLLIDAGEACLEYHDQMVRDVYARFVQCDETYSFCYSKQANVETARGIIDQAGTVWTWVGIDADTKLIVSWLAGGRTTEYALAFMRDLRSRISNNPQIATDGYRAYESVIEFVFGGDADYARTGRYSEDSEIESVEPERMSGRPNMDEIHTNYVERHNLTMRMSVKRLARQSNAFSKRFRNHIYALALYFVWYNFVRVHSTIGTTPAVAAGLTEFPMQMSDIVELINARVPRQVRGPYRKRVA